MLHTVSEYEKLNKYTHTQIIEMASVWETLQHKLPTARTPEAKKQRMELFNLFDPNGNGYLSLAECDKGCREQLHLDDLTSDLPPILIRAHTAAKAVGQRSNNRQNEDDYVQKSEFRVFLKYVKQYFELWYMFDEIDSSDDRRVSFDEFVTALPKLQEYGVAIADPREEFDRIDVDKGGMVLFREFADWAITKNLDVDGHTGDTE